MTTPDVRTKPGQYKGHVLQLAGLERRDSSAIGLGRRPTGTGIWTRPAALGLTIVTLAIAFLVELPILAQVIGPMLGDDARFYRDIGARWLEDGSFYLPHQLAGPYVITLQLDNVYPPTALALFVPSTFLPGLIWWMIPLGLTATVIASWRPAWWIWPFIALLIAWPKTISSVLWGNMDMWLVAGIAAGLRWGWPALLMTVKPSLIPFALVGFRHRSFWYGAMVIAVSAVLMWPLWAQYIVVMMNMTIPWDYSLGSMPVMLLPVAAWFGRSRHRAPKLVDLVSTAKSGQTRRDSTGIQDPRRVGRAIT